MTLLIVKNAKTGKINMCRQDKTVQELAIEIEYNIKHYYVMDGITQ